jgi:hypothetical protein
MTQTIDVTGLPPTVVSDLQRLVNSLRAQTQSVPETSARPEPVTPPPNETAEEWIARFRAWVESHPKRAIEFDDSRESIYEGRGE